MCRRSARVASVSSLMELRAGARAVDVGCSTRGGRSAWAAVGGPAVGGVEGWQRSMIFGAACEADGAGIAACGGLWSAMGRGPGGVDGGACGRLDFAYQGGVEQAQASLMVWHWNVGGAGVWIVQCWCRVCQSCFLSSVTSVWLTFRTVALSVVMRRSMGDRGVRRCGCSQDWVARRYAKTKRPQS